MGSGTIKTFAPWPYQAYCIERITADPNVGLFLGMGLGKTVIALSAIATLKYDMFAVQKVLLIAPKKVAEATWQKEADKWGHLSLLRFSTVLGSQAKRIKALHTPADVSSSCGRRRHQPGERSLVGRVLPQRVAV